MSTFDLYLHGTPNGHQIWGSDKNHDYINTFYNHDSNITDKAAMQIDICMGDSYYTYIHQQEVYDSNDRPGSFFAMTVCFPRSFCTNVYKLYQIFETVYSRVCVGSLIAQKQNKEIFLVSDFESSRSGNSATVDKIQAIFVKNIAELITPFISPLGNVPDTFNKAKKQYSLIEVDSPLFFDYFKKQSIVVLPNLEPASIVNQTISKQLNSVISQKKSLESSNSQLQSENSLLLKENQSLTKQLHTSASASEKKYSSIINQLKSDLKATYQERDELKTKIEDARSSIDLIDKPFQKLTRLLAGRFPENAKKDFDEDVESSKKPHAKYSKTIRTSRLNSILLAIIIALCLVILYFVALKPNFANINSNGRLTEPSDAVVTPKSENEAYEANGASTPLDANAESGTNTNNYDSWDSCLINIVGGGNTIVNGRNYTLKVQKKDFTAANVPRGQWLVWIDSRDQPINKDNKFILPTETATGTNVRVDYVVDGRVVLNRTLKVIK